MSDSPLLALPYLAASQAQKHVTLNDALSLVDGLLHLSVTSRVLATPPVAPVDGNRYLVATSATAEWLGHAGHVALRVAGTWRFLVPRAGWRAWIEAENILLVFNGTSWVTPPLPTTLQNLSLLGVNATADATNKMAVSSSSVLFNNVGAGVQFKINKSAPTDTASLLLQTGFSGRAEIGTAGDDDLHFKVSANGSSFFESLIVAGTSGKIVIKNTAVLDPQSAEPATPSNGQLWYNSTTGKFRGQQNGTSIDLVGSAGGSISDGDKGDITVAASGTNWTVDANAVSNSKLATMAAGTLKGNNAGGTANPADLTAAQVAALLGIAGAPANIAYTNIGNTFTSPQTAPSFAIDANANFAMSGPTPIFGWDAGDYEYFDRTNNLKVMVIGGIARQIITPTVPLNLGGTTSGSTGIVPAAIASGLWNLPARNDTFVGLADLFIGSGASHKVGLVPDAGAAAGTTRFLREDGTWITPPGGGGGAVIVQDEGVTLTAAVTQFNFTGPNIIASNVGSVVTVDFNPWALIAARSLIAF